MNSSEERELAIRAMKLAAERAKVRARRYGLKIGIWKNGAITFLDTEANAEQGSPANPNPSQVRESDG